MAHQSIAQFSVSQYQQLIDNEILTSDDHVELLENYVLLKVPENPPHDGTILRMGKRLGKRLPVGWDLRTQSAIVLADSQPEPDIAVVREDPADYTTRHPTPADVGWLIEVADASLLRDQRDKTRIYARAGIASYWIVNLVDRRIEVYAKPSGPTAVPAYGSFQTFQPADDVPLILDGITTGTISAADVLP